MSYASLLTSLQDKPAPVTVDGRECLTATAVTPDAQKLRALLIVRSDSSCAANFSAMEAGGLIICSGDLALDDDGNLPVVTVRSLCTGYEGQFLNEVCVTGRLSGNVKAADKSVSTSMAANRLAGGEEHADWFRIRGFGHNKTLLEEAPKGALVTVAGILEQRSNAAGETYTEVKARVIRLHARAKGHDHAEGTDAAGYSQSDFEGDAGLALPDNWN